MNDEIIRLREELVGLSSDPIKTRELLDKLTEEEIFQHDIESTIHIGKNEIEEEKDFDFYKVCKTRDGYIIHYKGGYTVFANEKLLSTCDSIALLMEDNVETDPEDKEYIDLTKSAVELIFRLPLFVFSHPATTFNLATIATKYLVYLQEKGEVPTEDTENPEYDKFMQQMNELMENFAIGLEKEGLEYERRNGISHDEEKVETKTETERGVESGDESDGKGEGENPEA